MRFLYKKYFLNINFHFSLVLNNKFANQGIEEPEKLLFSRLVSLGCLLGITLRLADFPGRVFFGGIHGGCKADSEATLGVAAFGEGVLLRFLSNIILSFFLFFVARGVEAEAAEEGDEGGDGDECNNEHEYGPVPYRPDHAVDYEFRLVNIL